MTEPDAASHKAHTTPNTAHIESTPASAPEEDTGVFSALLCYPVLAALSIYANLGATMYAYDHFALSFCLSMISFQLNYGDLVTLDTGAIYIIPARWQSLWAALPQVMTGVGAFCSGMLADRFGRRTNFTLSGLFSTAGIAVLYISSMRGVFLAGKMINAFGLGLAVATGQTYVSEIAPTRLRGILLSGYVLCLVIGMLAAGYLSLERTWLSDSAYKNIIAGGWAWSGIILLFAWVVPESPVYYIREGNVNKARKAFERIYPKGTDIDRLLEDAIRTNEEEKATAALAEGPHELKLITQIFLGLGVPVTLGIIFLVGKIRRRTALLSVITLCVVIYLPMGIAGCWPRNTKALWCVGVLLQLVTLLGVSPTTAPAQTIAAEIPALRLKAKSLAIGFLLNYVFSAIFNVVMPYLFTPSEGNLGGKTGFIFLATSIIRWLVVFFEVPETKASAAISLIGSFCTRRPHDVLSLLWRKLAMTTIRLDGG
ncbi:hypothetical protein BJX62DRAFT_242235 [Aspergillus germanicus]